MIVNLYVDHLASTPPQSAEDVWNDARTNPRVYSEAASKIGLSRAEYREFQQKLLDGKAVYVNLPLRVDSMAGVHRGHVYAVKNALMTTHVMGWRVRLNDGNVVYVPQTCGNLSVSYAPHRFVAPPVAYIPHTSIRKYVAPPPVVAVAPPAPVIVAPPEIPVYTPAAPVAAPAAVSAGHTNDTGLIAIPIIGGIIYGITHHDSPPAPPPCSLGSNAQFACTK